MWHPPYAFLADFHHSTVLLLICYISDHPPTTAPPVLPYRHLALWFIFLPHRHLTLTPYRQLHPPIVVLEDIYECKDLEQLLVAASALTRRPYIVAALSSGTTKGIPLHQLMFHHQIR